MKVQAQDHLLLLIALAATSNYSQAVASMIGAAVASTPNDALTPDFSGIWVHPSFPGFEPPPSGPGPVLNKSRMRKGPQTGVSNPAQLVGDYSNPILKPGAAAVVKKHGEISLSGEAYPTPNNQCWPAGVPFIFRDIAIQLLQQPENITILYDYDHEFRQVRMNQPHSMRVTPSWYGDFVGHYEGDTLVIDTVGVKIGPFAMVDMFGTPYTRALHVVERYRLLDYEAAKEGLERNATENFRLPIENIAMNFDYKYRGKHLQLQFTVEDEGVFTMPWSATITYGRPLGEWEEQVCAENTRDFSKRLVPTADKPDF